jgi:hypothetical protein
MPSAPWADAGYDADRYLRSLDAWGAARRLPRSGGWLLVRRVPGTDDHDALGGYPRLACREWTGLADDLADQGDLVSVLAVTDPFAAPGPGDLERAFPDLLRPFKDHVVVDLRHPEVTPRHRAKARQAAAALSIDAVDRPTALLDEWESLYAALRERHALRGIKALSRAAFEQQLGVPGCTAIRARSADRTVSMLLWYVAGDVATYHLGASSDEGYTLGASFALFAASMELFRDRGITWLDLGANAGGSPDRSDGLARFKRGWSPLVRPTWLGGRILRPDRYAALSEAVLDAAVPGWFPAYRTPEGG